MKNTVRITYFFALAVFLFSACNDDEMTTGPQNPGDIGAESLEWLSGFPTEDNQTLTYQNEDGETVILTVSDAYNSSSNFYVDCQIDGEPNQCQYENVALEFPEDAVQAPNPIVISIALIGPEDLRIMPTRGSIVVAAARFNDSTEEIRSEQNENFTVSYQADYMYDGAARRAITVLTNSVENLATGNVLPPKRLVLVKGVGVVEWEDYGDVTWTLED